MRLADPARRRLSLKSAQILAGPTPPPTASLGQPGVGGDGLARWGNWLVLTADLMLLCARLLCPPCSTTARTAQDAAEALRRQLLDRAQSAAAADWLERRPQLGRELFPRGRPDRTGAGGLQAASTRGTSPDCCASAWSRLRRALRERWSWSAK